ncbi:MAG TPA: YetF domain-containing protein [Stenomitos sp.]
MPTLLHYADIVLRTTTVYLFLIVGLRIAGKREMGQMTVFDLAVILVLSNAVQNAMVGPDTSLAGGLVAAATLLVLNHGMGWLRFNFRPIAHWVGGVPTLIIEDGHYVGDNLRKEGVTEEDIATALREHGVERVDQVHRAVLEPDGSISVVPKAGATIKRKRRVKVLKHH